MKYPKNNIKFYENGTVSNFESYAALKNDGEANYLESINRERCTANTMMCKKDSNTTARGTYIFESLFLHSNSYPDIYKYRMRIIIAWVLIGSAQAIRRTVQLEEVHTISKGTADAVPSHLRSNHQRRELSFWSSFMSK